RAQRGVPRVRAKEVVDVRAARREAVDERVDILTVEGVGEVLHDAHRGGPAYLERTLLRKRMSARLNGSACSRVTEWPPGMTVSPDRRMSLARARAKSGGVRMSSLPATISVGTLMLPSRPTRVPFQVKMPRA